MRPFSVCVFCGSRVGKRAEFAAMAEALGRAMGERGWRLVYGGGEVGLMGITATAVMRSGGQVLGIIPQHLDRVEIAKRDISELVVTRTMYDRKERMIDASDAFVCLPGGLGTLDELLEVMTLRQLRLHDKPIILAERSGFWAGIRPMLAHVVEEGFADRSALDLVETIEGEAAILHRLEAVASTSGPPPAA